MKGRKLRRTEIEGKNQGGDGKVRGTGEGETRMRESVSEGNRRLRMRKRNLE